MTIRIIIADDHSVVRQGLRMFLGLDPELEVVGEAVNGAEAVAQAEALRPDVVLMDLIMPVMSGLEATAEIRRRGLPTQVIVVTSVIEEAAVTAVISAGAIGYLLKDTEADELRRAIKAAAAGRAQLSPQIAARLLAETQSNDAGTLTDRENEVLRLAAEGLTDQEIALRLLVSEPVVHSHVAGIVERLRLADRSQTLLLDFANRAQSHQPWQEEGADQLSVETPQPASPPDDYQLPTIFIPLLMGGGAIGVLGLGGRPPLSEDELRFARLLANQAALSVEQARLHRVESQGQRMERELQQARRIQMSLLPGAYPQLPGYDFAAAYESAREIGGDLYDFIEWPADPARVGLLIADVSGKGTAAALFMAHSRAMIRGAAQTQPGPGATLAAANVQIARDNHAMLFVSAFYAVLEATDGRLTFANAGHNLPLIRRADGQIEEVMSRGMVLGIMDDMTYDEATAALAADDILLLYTDGITEAMDAAGELFGKARLMAAVAQATPATARDLIDAILAAVRDYTGDTPPADDLTIVTVKRIGN